MALHFLGWIALPGQWSLAQSWALQAHCRAGKGCLLSAPYQTTKGTQGLGPYHPLLVPILFERWRDLQAGALAVIQDTWLVDMVVMDWRLGLMFLEVFCVYSAIFSSNNLNFWFTDGSGPTLQDSFGARRWDLYQQYSEQSHWHSLEGAESHQQLSNDSPKCCYYVNKFSFILSRSQGIFLLTIKAK